MITQITNFIGNQKIFIFLKELFNKPIIRLLVLAILLLIAVFVSALIIKKPDTNRFGPLSYPKEATIVGEGLPAIKISFSFSKDTKIPSTINVYKIEPADEDKNRAFFDNVSRSLGATISAETKTLGQEKMYTVIQDNFYFTGNLLSGNFSFTGKSTKTIDAADEDSIKLSVWDTLSLLNLNSNVINRPNISYYNYLGDELSPSKNIALSDVISVSYQPSVDSLPVVGLGLGENPLSILVDRKTKNIIRLDYAIPKINLKETGSYSLLSLAELGKLPPDRFKLLSLVDEGGNKLANYNLNDFASINLNSLSLAYYITPEVQTLLQPVFVLKGNAVLKDGRRGIITAILPAVKNIK